MILYSQKGIFTFL